MRDLPGCITESTDDVSKGEEAAVDADALLGPVAGSARPLQPLRSGQVNKVELCCQRLQLSRRGGGGWGGRLVGAFLAVLLLVVVVLVLAVGALAAVGGGGVVVVCPRLSLLRDVDGEYGVRAGGLVVHVGGGGGAVEGAVLEALHRLVGRHHGAGGHADLRGEREKLF